MSHYIFELALFLLGGGIASIGLLRLLKNERFRYEEKLRDKEGIVNNLNEQITRNREELATLIAEKKGLEKSFEEKKVLLEQAEERLGHVFKGLSSEALKSNNESFLGLAEVVFSKLQAGAKGDLEKREQSIQETIKPIQRLLEQFNEKVSQLEKLREVAYTGLTEQIKHLSVSHGKLELEARNLSKALRAPNVRGQWGEMQLKRTVELAGMMNKVDFSEQFTINTEEGKLRPDMVIHLPEGRKIVVDAKTPLSAYLEAIEGRNREENLKLFAKHIRDHLVRLGTKSYWKYFEEAPEFVVLFLPGEAFYGAALEADPDLLEFSVKNQVILATPSMLIGLLKVIAYGWRQDKAAQNTKEVIAIGGEIYERIRVFGGYFEDLRRGLERSVGSYNKAVRCMESRILPSARKFQQYISSTEEIEILEEIEGALLKPRAEELTCSNP